MRQNPGFQGLQSPVPLGEDGLSGAGPLPGAPEAVLVRSTRSEENLPSQPGVGEEEKQAGFGTYAGGQPIHVVDIVELVPRGIFYCTALYELLLLSCLCHQFGGRGDGAESFEYPCDPSSLDLCARQDGASEADVADDGQRGSLQVCGEDELVQKQLLDTEASERLL